jgi:hypothetical protein
MTARARSPSIIVAKNAAIQADAAALRDALPGLRDWFTSSAGSAGLPGSQGLHGSDHFRGETVKEDPNTERQKGNVPPLDDRFLPHQV